MFNFFKFKTEDEFIASVSQIKKKIYSEIKQEISSYFETKSITKGDVRIMIHEQTKHNNDMTINNTCRIESLQRHFDEEIKKLIETNNILESKIETLLSVLRVNAKIED